MDAKLAVIVPIYNAEKYLVKCLDSVVGQSMTELEIILVNDGSTDTSLEICHRYARKDPRISIINKENGGVHDARNAGMKSVTSPYFTYLESDDWFLENTCEILYKMITTSNSDLALSSYYCVVQSGIKEKVPYNEDEVFFDKKTVKSRLMVDTLGPTDIRLRRPDLVDSLLTCTAKIYRTELVKHNHIQWTSRKETYSDCLDFLLRYMSVCESAYYRKVPTYYYRRTNSTSQTATFRPNTIELWRKQFKELYAFIQEKNFIFLMPAYNSRICFSIIPIGGNAYRMNNKKNAIAEINRALSIPEYSSAFTHFQINHLPLRFRPLFFFAKHRWSHLFYVMTVIMRKLMNRR